VFEKGFGPIRERENPAEILEGRTPCFLSGSCFNEAGAAPERVFDAIGPGKDSS
jgi:hypothetical protein